MVIQNIDVEIQKILPLLGVREKVSLLSIIKSFLELKQDTNKRISIEQYNKEIDEALQQVRAGNYITQDELEKEMMLW